MLSAVGFRQVPPRGWSAFDPRRVQKNFNRTAESIEPYLNRCPSVNAHDRQEADQGSLDDTDRFARLVAPATLPGLLRHMPDPTLLIPPGSQFLDHVQRYFERLVGELDQARHAHDAGDLVDRGAAVGDAAEDVAGEVGALDQAGLFGVPLDDRIVEIQRVESLDLEQPGDQPLLLGLGVDGIISWVCGQSQTPGQ